MQGEMVCGQHANAQTRRQCRVQEITNQRLILRYINKNEQGKRNVTCPSRNNGTTWTLLYLNVFATLPKSFCEQGDHVFMIVEELLNELAVASFCVLVFNLKDKLEKSLKNRTTN